MSDQGEATAEAEAEAERESQAPAGEADSEEADEEVVLDTEAAVERDAGVEELRQRVEEQSERIEDLEDLVLDLSVRVADDRAMGVCPDCHGPVMKMRRWIRPTTIECRRCGRVFHEP